MTQPKRYKLLSPIFMVEGTCIVGTEAKWNSGNYFIPFTGQKLGHYLTREQVEENPSWFAPEEVKQTEERITVEFEFMFPYGKHKGGGYNLSSPVIIPEEKLILIKQAIESILNNDPKEYWKIMDKVAGRDDAGEQKYQWKDNHDGSYTQLKYTQKELEQAEERAFNAGAEWSPSGYGNKPVPKYLSFQDYKKNKPDAGEQGFVDELVKCLWAYVRAQGRMRDRWSESDEAVKNELWKNLHSCEDAAREVLEKQPKQEDKGFVWNRAWAMEFAMNPDKYGRSIMEAVKNFESSKQQPSSNIYDGVKVKTFIHDEPGQWQEPKTQSSSGDKDWEVECFVAHGQNYWRQKSGMYKSCLYDTEISEEYLLEAQNCKIFSVRRTSDGVVFTVGDEIEYFGIGNIWHTDTIKSFKLLTHVGEQVANMNVMIDECGCELLSKIKKTKSQPPSSTTKEPLFRTEDGKDIFEGDSCFILSMSNWYVAPVSHAPSKPFYGVNNEGFKYFSTQEAANEYVLMNKPCLSVKDIMNDHYRGKKLDDWVAFTVKTLKNIAQSKINVK